MNQVILCGRLGQNPEVKQFGEHSVTNFSVATSKKIKGEDQVQWHNIQAWGKTGEICAQYLAKGSQVLLQGELRYNTKDDKKYTSIVANHVEFVGPKVERADQPPANLDNVPF